MATEVVTKRPCAKCPFRKDVPIYLRCERRTEIARALAEGQAFWCHGTVTHDEDQDGEEVPDVSEGVFCAGAAKAMLLTGHTPANLRVAERLDLVDLDEVAETGAEVWSLIEWPALAEGSTGDEAEHEEVETCNTVEAGCLAPAGYLCGDGVVVGTDAADERCKVCDEAVCSACIDADGRCGSCSEHQW